jgi:hypothetical protein
VDVVGKKMRKKEKRRERKRKKEEKYDSLRGESQLLFSFRYSKY